jgi:hypothetical protein
MADSSLNGYTVLRLVHSHWRWLVVALALAVVARALGGVRGRRPWSRSDERCSVAFIAAVDVQLVLGLVLYFGFSPFFTALHQSPHAALHDQVTRFFGIEHQTAMLIAVIIAHVGRIRSRRLASDDPRRHRVMLVTLALFCALVLWAIPWPWRAVGRPLLRFTL